MINYESYLKIGELSEQDRLSAAQIAAELNIAVGTVKKWLKVKSFDRPKRAVKSSKLDPYRKLIRGWLNAHDYSAVQILRMLRDEGFDGGSTIVRDYVSRIRPPKQTAYLTLKFAPGEAAQVDFGYCGMIQVGDTRRRLYVFVMTLCYSRMMYAQFIMRQNMEHFLQCHRNAFEYFKGIPRKVMVDNCKVAVVDASRYGDPVLNKHYADLAMHYGFRIVPCGVRKPNEKGRVERGIGYIKGNFFNGLEFSSLTDLNFKTGQWLDNTANVRIHGTTRKPPTELFTTELKAMNQLPLFPYDCCDSAAVRVNSQYRVIFETNKYSLPPEMAGRCADISVYTDKLIFSYEGKEVARHVRSYERYQDFGLAEHDRPLLEQRKKARYDRTVGKFLELGEVAEKYYAGMKSKLFNVQQHVCRIVALLDTHGKREVIRAMTDAMKFEAYSSDYILNILDMRSRVIPQVSALHVTRKSDCLNIDFAEPDLNIY